MANVQANLVEKALSDLATIRSSIVSLNDGQSSKILASSYKVSRFLHLTSVIIVSLFVLTETVGPAVFGVSLTSTMIEKNSEQFYRVLGVGAMALILAFCVTVLYLSIRKAAKENAYDLRSYIKKNFAYLQRLSHLSDLAIKFAVVTALILGRRPEWIAPFLLLFTSDYLLQGRFFILRVKRAQGLAVLALFVAIAQFAFESPALIWSFLIWILASLMTLNHLSSLKKVEDNEC